MEHIEEVGAILTDWAFNFYLPYKLDKLVNDDMEALNDITWLKRYVTVAVQEDPTHRATMLMVTQMLEGLAEVPDSTPCQTYDVAGHIVLIFRN